MTDSDLRAELRGGRMRVARSRGATSGVLLIILGAWAAIVPFIGPYLDFAFLPQPDEAWNWTTGRGLYEVLPGAAAVLGGLFLLASANRVAASFGGWLAAASGGWLIVGPVIAGSVGVSVGAPDPTMSQAVIELAVLLFFYGIGGAIILVAALALGRLSVHSVRDVRVARRRAEREAEQDARERAAVEQAQRGRNVATPDGARPAATEPAQSDRHVATPDGARPAATEPAQSDRHVATPDGAGPATADRTAGDGVRRGRRFGRRGPDQPEEPVQQGRHEAPTTDQPPPTQQPPR